MKNNAIFEEALVRAAEIRKDIQENMRKKYKAFMKAFGIMSGTDGKKLKFITDMLYYKDGGYPNEESLPKHEEVLNNFIDLVKYMDLLGKRNQFVDGYLRQHGITVALDSRYKIENLMIDGDTKHKTEQALKEYNIRVTAAPLKNLTEAFLQQTMAIQSEICSKSDEIKHDLAATVENNCEVKKSDFISSVRFEVLADKNVRNPKRLHKAIETERKNFTSKVDVFKVKLEKVRPTSSSPSATNS